MAVVLLRTLPIESVFVIWWVSGTIEEGINYSFHGLHFLWSALLLLLRVDCYTIRHISMCCTRLMMRNVIQNP